MMIWCDSVTKRFHTRFGYLTAVDDVTLTIEKGEAFGLVGESGSGKTTLGKIILGLVRPDAGGVRHAKMRMQAIFQDPYNSLDPKMRVRDILAEGLILQRETDVSRTVERILDLIRLPKTALAKYPHQFSGGERQRIAIGRAVVTNPDFIVCDEPVSSLDVTIQLQILNLLRDIRSEFGITYLFISHDLRVIRYMCGKVAVMKEGKIIEEGPVARVYAEPAHPYTKQLLSSVLHVTPR